MFPLLRKYYLILILPGMLFLLSSTKNPEKNISTPKTFKTNAPNPEGFALVELFTSEGCSSCPPADEAVGRIPPSEKNVYVLSFHVDYWDYLGWKDSYSNAAYSARQKQYSSWFHSDNIYTPQIVVNGKEEFVGSNESKLKEAIDHSLKETPAAHIEIKNISVDQHQVTVLCHSSGISGADLNLALVQKMSSGFIQRGENKGRTLTHYFTVRDFKTVAGQKDSVSFRLNLPDNLKASDCALVAFVQNKQSGYIVAATGANLP